MAENSMVTYDKYYIMEETRSLFCQSAVEKQVVMLDSAINFGVETTFILTHLGLW